MAGIASRAGVAFVALMTLMVTAAAAEPLIAHEFVILRERGDQLAYEVHPSGRDTTVFLSTQIGPGSVVF